MVSKLREHLWDCYMRTHDFDLRIYYRDAYQFFCDITDGVPVDRAIAQLHYGSFRFLAAHR